MTALGNQLVRQEAEEISRGIRLLLATPLLVADHDRESFDVVRRRRGPLQKWFDYYCGWRLVVEPRLGYARLVKVRNRPNSERPARRQRSGRAPFDRRRYTLFCVLAAELLSGPVTTIGLLADRVVQATANDAEVPTLDTARRDERSAFVDALKLLERFGAAVAADGVTEAYLEHEDAKVLYRVDHTRLLRLLAAPVPPSRVAEEETAGEAGEATNESAGESEDAAAADKPGGEAESEVDARVVDPDERLKRLLVEARYGDAADPAGDADDVRRNLWARHSLMRRLFEEPVTYRADLSQAERAYAESLTGRRLIRQAAEQAGLILEERAEGFLLVDADALATDDKFPDDRNNAKVAALLLLDELVAAGAPLDRADLVKRAEALLATEPSWARAYQSEGGAARLADDGVRVLCGFGLARRDEGAVRALPAAARYTVVRPDSTPDERGPDHGQQRSRSQDAAQ
ncbi:TIGR02678 family protein [Actinopolymorpha alba]|uniref:TIGR02678 family protein n=1 Tax=Actinopolymorpha alba TaxID=533267 RepID=UPI00036DC117|nr:TIGR02678 family protein [Actinopolymorpha alba]